MFTCMTAAVTAGSLTQACSPDLEVIGVLNRPFYLTSEFTVVIVIAGYCPPDANVSMALSLLLATINKTAAFPPEGVFIGASNFSQACLKTVLPKFRKGKTPWTTFIPTSNVPTGGIWKIRFTYEL